MLKRFRSDKRGVAAVEFALMAPVMVLMYFGMAEVSLAFLAERRAAHAASVVADLVAQPARLTAAQVDDVFNVAEPLLRPFPAAGLSMRVSNVKADPQGVPKVVWSRGDGMSALTVSSVPEGVPAGLLAPGQVIILTELTYEFESPLGHVLPNGLTFHESARAWPRKIDVALN